MPEDTDTTQWSLPGGTDLPRDELKLQLEVYNETILLRGFENDSAWVRTVSADEIANVFTQHLGFSLGAAAGGNPLVEPGRDRAGGGPVAAAAGLAGGPATGGVQASRPAPASHAGAGLRLLAGPCALGLRSVGASGRRRAASLPGPGLQRLRRRAGLPRKPQVPRGGWADTGVLLPVLLLAHRRHPQPLEEAPREPDRAMGGDRWNDRIPDGGPCSPVHGGPGDGGLRGETWLPPLAPGRGRWATWSTTPPGSLAPTESDTTTCWDRTVSTSSPGAPT